MGRCLRSRVLAGLAGILAIGLGSAWLAAGRQVPGTIRVTVALVPIDVVVTDQDDGPVTGLAREDFTVIEDGVRQSVAHFEVRALAADQTSPAAAKVSLRRIPAAELAPEKRRTFLVVLGRGRHQNPSHGVDALITFVREQLLPQDVVAVMAWNRATDFTADHEKAAQVLERYKKYHEGIDARLSLHFSGLAAIYGGKEIPKSFQPEIARIFDTPGALPARQVPPGRITHAGKLADDTRQATDTLQRVEVSGADAVSPLEQVQADAVTDLPFDEFVSKNAQTLQDLQNLYTAVEYLRYVEGEKHLLFFCDQGLFLPRMEHDQGLAAMASDARVVIDTFQTGGVNPAGLPSAEFSGASAQGRGGRGAATSRTPAPARPSNASRMFALSSLRTIAQLTGGRAAIHADIGQALSRVNEVTRAGYLLGYYPKNPVWDGKYRKITVRVNRPGLKLSYRRGYYARNALQPYDRKAFLTYSRISAAAQYADQVRDIKVRVAAHPAATSSGREPEVQVDLVIDAAKIPFRDENGLHSATLQLTTFYADGRGRVLGDVWQDIVLNLKPDTWQRVQREGVAVSTRVPLKAPDQQFKVIVYSYEADRVGSAVAKLKR
jgi:VWFA-related protein